MSLKKNYKIFYTMADMGINVRGENIKELIINSVIGFSVVLGKFRKNKKIEESIKILELKFNSYENILVKLLNELLYIFEVEGLCLITVEKIDLQKNSFMGKFRFGKINKNNFFYKNIIKAVTYHNLNIEKKRKYFYANIIFDI